MRGLLIKDFYMVLKYYRMVFLVIAVFSIAAVFSDNNVFFIVYPMIFAGISSLNLIAYDEKNKWDTYCISLPISRSTIVSSKYIGTFIFITAVWIVSAVSQMIKVFMTKGSWNEYFILIFMLLAVGLAAPVIVLPIIFKLGIERGRIVYYFASGAYFAAAAIVMSAGTAFKLRVPEQWIVYIGLAFAAAAYAVSWMVSIKIYNKRELG